MGGSKNDRDKCSDTFFLTLEKNTVFLDTSPDWLRILSTFSKAFDAVNEEFLGQRTSLLHRP